MNIPPRTGTESAQTAWTALAGPGYPLPIFEMHSRGDTRVYLLRNTLLPPYKTPALPDSELPPKVHDLLLQLKIAQAFLVESIELAQDSLSDSYRSIGVVHSVELPLPVPEYHQRFERWSRNQFPEPCLVAALELVTCRSSHYFLSLELSPLHPPKRRHPKGISQRVLASLALASRLYNEAARDLFDNGIVVFPCYLSFQGGELFFAARGVPDWAVLLDI
jgi:hypothetical protein